MVHICFNIVQTTSCVMMKIVLGYSILTPASLWVLTLPMLRLLMYKAQGRKYIWKSSKPSPVDIHWIALAEYSHISAHVPGFQSFSFIFLHYLRHIQ